MTSRLDWADRIWNDPDGGTIHLHGTLPTVVYPEKLRPRIDWDGLAILATDEEAELWEQEEKDEREDEGVNLDSALLAGGLDSVMLDRLMMLPEIQAGRFPDPEPRRLHRAAQRHNRPIFFIEPDADRDEEWAEHLTEEAKSMTTFRKLLSTIRTPRKFDKAVRRIKVELVDPPRPVDEQMGIAAVLCAAWWRVGESRRGEQISTARDARLAARLRGALANLRKSIGDNATLMVPLFQDWRDDIVTALNEANVEEVSSSKAPSSDEEE